MPRASVSRIVLGLAMVVLGLGVAAAAALWIHGSSYRSARLQWLLDHPSELLGGLGWSTLLIALAPIALILIGLALTLTASPNAGRAAKS